MLNLWINELVDYCPCVCSGLLIRFIHDSLLKLTTDLKRRYTDRWMTSERVAETVRSNKLMSEYMNDYFQVSAKSQRSQTPR